MDASALTSILRQWLAGGAPTDSLRREDFAAAQGHRLAGALHQMGAPLDPGDAAQAARAWTENTAGHLRRVELLQRVWRPEWPRPLIFKGADLAENVYGDPGARRASDLDLLVPDPLFDAVAAQLSALADTRRHPRTERRDGDAPYEIAFRFGTATLELHRAFQPLHRGGLNGSTVYERAEPGRLGQVDVLYPKPVDRVLVWLINQVKQSFFGDLADQLDLALLLRALGDPDPPWDALAAAADTSGLSRAWALARDRLDAAALRTPAPARHRTRGLRLVAGALPPPTIAPGQIPALQFQAIKLWLAEGQARREILARAWPTWRERRRTPKKE